jgi:hypothetical protein
MPIAKRLTIENVNPDDEQEMAAFVNQMFSVGLERVRAEGDVLRRRGILDSEGNLLLKVLPADMKEGAERDCGG